MKEGKFISIKLKLALSVALSIITFGMVAVVINYLETSKAFVEISKQGQVDATTHVAKSASELFEIARNVAENTAMLPEVKNLLADISLASSTLNETNLTERRNFARMMLSHYNVRNLFSSIYVLNASGTAVVSTDISFEGNDYSFRKYFQKAMAGETAIDMAVGVTSKKPGFYFSQPIVGEDGQKIGVAVAKLDTKAIDEIFTHDKMAGFINYMLVGTDGMVLISNIPGRNFTHLDTSLLSAEEKDKILKQYNLTELKSLDYGMAFEEIEKGTKDKMIDIYDSLENEHEIITIGHIGDFPYYFVTEHYSDMIMGFARRPAVVSLIIQVSGLIFTFVLSYLLIARFINPIKKLKEGAEKISSGSFEISIPTTTNDEISVLAKTLEKTASDLKNLYGNLNEEVKKKTEELRIKMADMEKLNEYMVGRELKMAEMKKEITDLKNQIEKLKKA